MDRLREGGGRWRGSDVTNQEVLSSESRSHELADPFILVELFTGRVGYVVVSSLASTLGKEQGGQYNYSSNESATRKVRYSNSEG